MAQEDSGDFNAFLRKVQQETKEDVENYFLSKRDTEAIESCDQSHNTANTKEVTAGQKFNMIKMDCEMSFFKTCQAEQFPS